MWRKKKKEEGREDKGILPAAVAFPANHILRREKERERKRERERENVGFLLCSAVRVQVRVFRIWLHKVSRFDEPWREDHNISHLAYRHRLGSQIYKVSISWLLYFVIMLAGGWVQIGQLLNLY